MHWVWVDTRLIGSPGWVTDYTSTGQSHVILTRKETIFQLWLVNVLKNIQNQFTSITFKIFPFIVNCQWNDSLHHHKVSFWCSNQHDVGYNSRISVRVSSRLSRKHRIVPKEQSKIYSHCQCHSITGVGVSVVISGLTRPNHYDPKPDANNLPPGASLPGGINCMSFRYRSWLWEENFK